LFLDITLSISTYIRICNHGFYLAKCYLELQSFSSGLEIRRYDTGLFPIADCPRFNIPVDVIWNRLECKALTFIATYSTIFTKDFSSELLNLCYTISGSILNPSWSKTKC
jgi:hypothetical protein